MKVLQVVGYKNVGKTTLVCEIVRMLSTAGLRVGTLKRDAHDVDPEPADADTRGHREAGAFMSGFTSSSRTAWVRERPSSLNDMLGSLSDAGADAVIVEGFKAAPYPKLVLLRGSEDAELFQLSGIIAAAIRTQSIDAEAFRNSRSSGSHLSVPASLPLFYTNDRHLAPLLDFVRKWFAL